MLSRKGMPLLFAGMVSIWIVAGGAVAHVSTLPPTPAVDDSKVVKVRDSCTPSFNVFFQDPTICQQLDGKVDIFAFLDYLSKHLMHPLWRFDPQSFDLPVGKHVQLQNLGGEFHTWTEVANFGGGIITALNFGAPTVPECGLPDKLAPESIKNVYLDYQDSESGATAGTSALPAGSHKFMCCIHPWMQTVVQVNGAGTTTVTPMASPAHANPSRH
jgi:hypothetical protein